jgi:hypothetical protein
MITIKDRRFDDFDDEYRKWEFFFARTPTQKLINLFSRMPDVLLIFLIPYTLDWDCQQNCCVFRNLLINFLLSICYTNYMYAFCKTKTMLPINFRCLLCNFNLTNVNYATQFVGLQKIKLPSCVIMSIMNLKYIGPQSFCCWLSFHSLFLIFLMQCHVPLHSVH